MADDDAMGGLFDDDDLGGVAAERAGTPTTRTVPTCSAPSRTSSSCPPSRRRSTTPRWRSNSTRWTRSPSTRRRTSRPTRPTSRRRRPPDRARRCGGGRAPPPATRPGAPRAPRRPPGAVPPLPARHLRRGHRPGARHRAAAARRWSTTGSTTPTCSAARAAAARPRRRASWPAASTASRAPTPTPCGVCQSCRDLARGGAGSIDVIEIDAASHGGVDEARDLRERAFFAPGAQPLQDLHHRRGAHGHQRRASTPC